MGESKRDLPEFAKQFKEAIEVTWGAVMLIAVIVFFAASATREAPSGFIIASALVCVWACGWSIGYWVWSMQGRGESLGLDDRIAGWAKRMAVKKNERLALRISVLESAMLRFDRPLEDLQGQINVAGAKAHESMKMVEGIRENLPQLIKSALEPVAKEFAELREEVQEIKCEFEDIFAPENEAR